MCPHTRDCSGPFQNPFGGASICPFGVLVDMIYFKSCHGLEVFLKFTGDSI